MNTRTWDTSENHKHHVMGKAIEGGTSVCSWLCNLGMCYRRVGFRKENEIKKTLHCMFKQIILRCMNGGTKCQAKNKYH